MPAPRLQDVFNHLLPILNDSDYIPIPVANSTTIDADPIQLNATFLHDVLNDASRALLDDYLPPAPEEEADETLPNDILSPLTFFNGRKRGQQCSYNGYIYSLNKTRPDGHRYWDCKDRKLHSCKGRLSTLGDSTVTKENPHSHPRSLKDVGAEQFLSKIRTDNSASTAANVVRELLLTTPDAVQTALPAPHNMKKQINNYRQKIRGHPSSSTATCAADINIPL